MREAIIKLNNKIKFYGFNLRVMYLTITRLPGYYKDLKKYKSQVGDDKTFPMSKHRPILTDASSDAGSMTGHYFHQDLYVARRIFEVSPDRHLDIGSRIDGFVAHVAAFRRIEVIDIRPMVSKVDNIGFQQADMMLLPPNLQSCTDSLSSLHAIEHFGLGRYGDPIDHLGYLKAIENSVDILKPGGTFYFSVPMGPQRVEFNAQRIFSMSYLLQILTKNYEVARFSYVDDIGDFHEDVEITPARIKDNFGCFFGCGIFELIKK